MPLQYCLYLVYDVCRHLRLRFAVILLLIVAADNRYLIFV